MAYHVIWTWIVIDIMRENALLPILKKQADSHFRLLLWSYPLVVGITLEVYAVNYRGSTTWMPMFFAILMTVYCSEVRRLCRVKLWSDTGLEHDLLKATGEFLVHYRDAQQYLLKIADLAALICTVAYAMILFVLIKTGALRSNLTSELLIDLAFIGAIVYAIGRTSYTFAGGTGMTVYFLLATGLWTMLIWISTFPILSFWRLALILLCIGFVIGWTKHWLHWTADRFGSTGNSGTLKFGDA